MPRQRVVLTLAILGLLAFSVDARAQLIVNLSTPGARATAMGGAFIAVADDATTAVTNPAGLSNLSIPEVYGEVKGGNGLGCDDCNNPFSSPFLSFLSFATPLTSKMTIGGFRNQNVHLRPEDEIDNIDESIYGVALGALVAPHLRVGGNVGWVHATFGDGESTNGVRVTGGVQYQAMDKLTVGATATGVSQITNDGGVLNDSRIGGGVAYAALPKLLVSADVSHYLDDFDFSHSTTFGAGAEYVIFGRSNDRFFVRGGGCTCNPFYDGGSATVGFGYATQRRFQTDVSYASGINELTVSAVVRY